MRWMILLAVVCVSFYMGDNAWADPFDADEAYVNRGAPDMLGYTGLALMMLNYVLFGLAVVVFGKALVKGSAWLVYVSQVVSKPWSFGVKRVWQEGRHWSDIPLTVVMVVCWVFLCQFFNEMNMGAVAMIGLAFMAVVLLRLMKD